MRLTLVAVLVLLAVPGAATAADERRLSTESYGGLDAEGGWTIWQQIEEEFGEYPVVPQWRHNGRVVHSIAPLGALGTTAHGNVVVVDHRCGARRTCSVNQRRPASLAARRLVRRSPLQISDVDEYGGTLAFTVDHRPYVRRRGQSRFERVDSLFGSDVEVGNGFLVYRAFEHDNPVVRLVDFRGRRPHARTLPVDARTIGISTVEGAYVYWLQRTYSPAGDVVLESEVFRAPARNPAARVEVFRPARPAYEFAVDGARLVYAADGYGQEGDGVFEVDRPDWHAAP